MTRQEDRTDSQARLAVLARTGPILGGSREQGRALHLLAQMLVPVMGEWCGIDVLDASGTLHRAAAAGEGAVTSDVPHGPGVVVRTGEPELTPQLLCVPMVARDGPVGALTLRSDRPVYGRADLELAGELAHRTAEAIERAALHRSLVSSEERYRMLFDQNPLPMWVYDVDTLRFLAVNDAAVRHYGYLRTEFLSMDITEIRPQEEVEALIESIHQQGPGSPIPGTWKHQRKDGSLIDVEITAGRVVWDGREAALVLANDVSERRRLEQRLVEAERMEAIGRLAGGVAHDFNNLLTIIHGYASVLRGRAGDSGEELSEILHATEQASTLTREMLAFSRRQVMHATVVDLNEVVAAMQSMLQRIIGDDVGVGVRFGQSLAPVEADRAQIERVILNLAANARDAMPDGGRLTIETANVELDAQQVASHPGDRPGPHVLLAVSDTGCGMTEEVKRHLFEPFFTTKGPGKGTGLGLAVVHGIVQQFGGHVTVHSTPGAGTRFEIYLPREWDEAPAGASYHGLTGGPSGTETVLLVEDEQALRTLGRHVLRRCGYNVLEAADGAAALRLCAGHGGPLHLLVTDVVMPGMGGRQLAEQLQPQYPGLKVLYLSGYTDDAVVRHGVLWDEVNFLQKPFPPFALAHKVREVLDG